MPLFGDGETKESGGAVVCPLVVERGHGQRRRRLGRPIMRIPTSFAQNLLRAHVDRTLVGLDVLAEMVRSRKGLAAQRAAVRLVASVRPSMPGQLVGPREPPVTPRLLALKRLLARVSPDVGLEVRTLGVDLVASRVLARVLVRPSRLWLCFAPRGFGCRSGARLLGGWGSGG